MALTAYQKMLQQAQTGNSMDAYIEAQKKVQQGINQKQAAAATGGAAAGAVTGGATGGATTGGTTGGVSGYDPVAAAQQKLAQVTQRNNVMKNGTIQQQNQYLQSQQGMNSNAYQAELAKAQAAQATPQQMQDYISFARKDPNFQSGMDAEDQASWDAIGKKYASGDASWNKDTNSFREDGKWGSYTDSNGKINGWLMAADGTGGYAPVFGGKVGETGYKAGTVFYAPDGSAYTMAADGTLSKSGNVTWLQYGQGIGPQAGYHYGGGTFIGRDADGNYKTYDYGTVSDEDLARHGYVRDGDLIRPINDEYTLAQKIQNGELTPGQIQQSQAKAATENAKNQGYITRGSQGSYAPTGGNYGAQNGGSSGGGYIPSGTTGGTSGGGTYPSGDTTPPGTTPNPYGNTTPTTYQDYLAQWDYGPAPEWTGGQDETYKELENYDYGQAPEWTGSQYEQQRDDALKTAQDMQWDGSQYQNQRDQLVQDAMQPWEGSQYDPMRDEALAKYGEEWTPSEYQQQRDDALKKAQDMRFSYDPNTDPNWQAYQKQYRREGQRATQNALGQAAAMTGGVPSSYAVTAASQAGDYYASQLSDKLPQLYNDAYNRYLQEFQKQLGISDQYQGFDDREYSRWADQQGRNLDLADRYNQYGQQEYGQFQDSVSQKLAGADRYNDYDQSEYQRYLDQYGQQLDAADRYNQYGEQDYDKYRDQLGQYNTDRAFRYGVNRDYVSDSERANDTAYQRYLDSLGQYNKDKAMSYEQYLDAINNARYDDETAYNRAWNEDERRYSREYQQWRDQVGDQRYDQEWAQQLREYADSQNWKAKDWEQYLREYEDKLSNQEREWAYQQYRDAVSDARYNQEYADSRADTAYSRALADEERAYNRAWNEDERDYERGWDATKWNQALREYDDEQAQQAWNNEYKLNSKSGSGSGGGGRSTGGTKASAETTTPSSGQYDESGRRAGTWQDSDGYTYSGYHADGQPKSAQYDSVRSKAKQSAGQGKAAVTRQLLAEVDARRITEYEAFMILEELGFRNGADRTGTSTGRNFIGPTNVQMVQ